jgi:hypothetical protein
VGRPAAHGAAPQSSRPGTKLGPDDESSRQRQVPGTFPRLRYDQLMNVSGNI